MILRFEHRKIRINEKLTLDELTAIKHYKDLIHPQFKWDYKPLKYMLKGVGIDCCIVNNILRGRISKSSLTYRDMKNYEFIVKNLVNVINKSVVVKDTYVYKGLSNSSWIEKYDISDTYYDDAFGSFTPLKTIADKYAKQNSNNKRVYVYQKLDKGTNALYLEDGGEKEYILPPNIRYQIYDIVKHGQTIIYYVRRANN